MPGGGVVKRRPGDDAGGGGACRDDGEGTSVMALTEKSITDTMASLRRRDAGSHCEHT